MQIRTPRFIAAAAPLLWLLSSLVPAPAAGQNVSAVQVRLVPGLPPFTCPAGRVCLLGSSGTTPYRAVLVDSAGGQVGAGDAWRLRLYPGQPPASVDGDAWYDTSAHAAYVMQNGVATGMGPLSFPAQLAGRFFAGPCSGAAAAAAFRSLCAADLTAALTTPPPIGQTTPGLVKGTTVQATVQFTGSCAGCTNIPGSQIVGPVPVGSVPVHASTHLVSGTDPLSTGTPVAVGTANGAGTSASFSRADHVHNHGTQPGGALHAEAVSGGASGFLTGADKAKIDLLATPLPVIGNGTAGSPDASPVTVQGISGGTPLPVSHAAASQADGHSANIGALADASSASTLTGLLKAVKAAVQGTLAVSMAAAPVGAALDATLTGGTMLSRVTDGTNTAAVKNSSTAAIGSDKALVVAISPNNVVSVAAAGAAADGAAAAGNPVYIGGKDSTATARGIAVDSEGRLVRAPTANFVTFSAATAGTLVHSGKAVLRSIVGGYSGTATTITCYNGTSASGTYVSNSLTTGYSLSPLAYDVVFGTGIYCVTTGAVQSWTVTFDY